MNSKKYASLKEYQFSEATSFEVQGLPTEERPPTRGPSTHLQGDLLKLIIFTIKFDHPAIVLVG
jgi:hypothetical protein